jgi:hypothetical protein
VGDRRGAREAEFGRRLAEIGGAPPGWQIYPLADGSGQALHLVAADDERAIDEHLAHFAPGYARGSIAELIGKEQTDVG